MKRQSKAKLLKVLKTLQGYQRRAFGTKITLEVGTKKIRFRDYRHYSVVALSTRDIQPIYI